MNVSAVIDANVLVSAFWTKNRDSAAPANLITAVCFDRIWERGYRF